MKVEDRFNKDKIQYETAIKAFINNERTLNGDLGIQKLLHTFAEHRQSKKNIEVLVRAR